MEVGRSEFGRERSEERYQGDTPASELEEGAFDDSEQYDKENSRDLTKSRSKDKKKSRKEEKDHKSRDKDRSKTNDDIKERDREVKDSEKDRISSKEKRRDGREEREKDRPKDKVREKDHERDKHKERDHDRDKDEKDRARKKDRENDPESNRGRDRESGKDKSKEMEKEREKEKAKDKDRGKDRDREKEKERARDRDKERDYGKNRDKDILDREHAKDIIRERERTADHDKDKYRDREKGSRSRREDYDRNKDIGKDSKAKVEAADYKCRETSKQRKTSVDEDDEIIKPGDYVEEPVGASHSQIEVEQRILKFHLERLGKKSDSASEILSWVSKSRKIEEKTISEREKALRRSKILQEQDNLDEDDHEDDTAGQDALAGVRILHGLDKVLEGGAVVLTLKDQDILTNGDINEDVDMLENVEIGEQKQRNEAYKAAKKTAGVYDDKFNDQLGEEKKMLPQYDDPAKEEGLTLAAGGRLTAEAEKKLDELRKRLQGGPVKSQAEDLSSSVKISSDYFTPEEMLKFKKPKKKKSLRKKDKLDIDALEAEAISSGLGAEDLGSRKDNRSQVVRQEQERSDAERRLSAYKDAYAKAEEASKALRMEQGITVAKDDDDVPVFAEDAEDLQKSLERARKLALKKQNEKATVGPEAVARLAASSASQQADAQDSTSGEQDNKVVFTEMEEFVWGLQLDEDSQKPTHEDVFMEEDEAPKAPEEKKDEPGGWTKVPNSGIAEQSKTEDKEEVVPVESIHEAPVGKGLAGALQMLKERGSLKETIDWGGRNMDKKKSKLVGIYDDEGPKEIHLERTDEYGRILTPKEAFRLLSHKFHGKGPGKMKLEKRMKQYHDELKLKKMTSSDAVPQSVERMREAQAQLKTPYLVLSGNVKPGQTSDPRSGFATVEKELPGGLTPMLGDRKVEHFLGIKRKPDSGSSGIPKKPKQ